MHRLNRFGIKKIRYFTNPTIRIQAQVELEFNNRINPPPSKEITFIEYFGRKSRPNTPKSAYVRFRRSIPFTFLKINRFFFKYKSDKVRTAEIRYKSRRARIFPDENPVRGNAFRDDFGAS